MSPAAQRPLSILACLTGLALTLVFFVATWRGTPTPLWMPMLIAAIGGFELFVTVHGFWARRAALRRGGR